MARRTGQAREVFERAVAHVNDVGLLAEEVDPVSGEQLGNFPQAFSHMGLINAAWTIDQAERQVGDYEDGAGTLVSASWHLPCRRTRPMVGATRPRTWREEVTVDVVGAACRHNAHHHCMAVHSTTALRSGANGDTVTALREGKSLADPQLEAVRRLTHAVAADHGDM